MWGSILDRPFETLKRPSAKMLLPRGVPVETVLGINLLAQIVPRNRVPCEHPFLQTRRQAHSKHSGHSWRGAPRHGAIGIQRCGPGGTPGTRLPQYVCSFPRAPAGSPGRAPPHPPPQAGEALNCHFSVEALRGKGCFRGRLADLRLAVVASFIQPFTSGERRRAPSPRY